MHYVSRLKPLDRDLSHLVFSPFTRSFPLMHSYRSTALRPRTAHDIRAVRCPTDISHDRSTRRDRICSMRSIRHTGIIHLDCIRHGSARQERDHLTSIEDLGDCTIQVPYMDSTVVGSGIDVALPCSGFGREMTPDKSLHHHVPRVSHHRAVVRMLGIARFAIERVAIVEASHGWNRRQSSEAAKIADIQRLFNSQTSNLSNLSNSLEEYIILKSQSLHV
jgi:hypothetical protein